MILIEPFKRLKNLAKKHSPFYRNQLSATRAKEEIQRFNILRKSANAFFGNYGSWLYDEWLRHNKKLFNSELNVPIIQCGLTPYGRTEGYYIDELNMITLHWSLIPNKFGKSFPARGKIMPFGINPSKEYASDTLLHEMIHQNLHQKKLYKKGDDSHMCDAWINELNRIAPLIGLDEYYFCRFKRTKEQVTRKDIYVPVGVVPAGKKMAHRDAIRKFPSPLKKY